MTPIEELVNGVARMAKKRIQKPSDIELGPEDLATVMHAFPEVFEVLHEEHTAVAYDVAEKGYAGRLIWSLLDLRARELILADVRVEQQRLEDEREVALS